MSQHTPGPWTVEFGEDSGYDCMSSGYILRGPKHEWIAAVDVADYVKDRDNYEASHAEHPVAAANARLIAAAPALREALERAKEVIRTWHGMDMHGNPDEMSDEAWALYQDSPEMKVINTALRQARGEG